MDPTAQQDQQNTPSTPPTSVGSGGISKEVEVGDSTVEVPGFREVGKVAELPPEVSAVGVKVKPTTVTVPPPVSTLGVRPPGATPPLVATNLPLTDDQIAQGLKQSLASSWRWLAEWCKRKLKQLHLTIKSIGGKNVEVKPE